MGNINMHVLKFLVIVLTLGIVAAYWVFSGSTPGIAATKIQQKGSAIYSASCASCHASDGSGSTRRGKRKGAKDLRKSKISFARGISTITNGKSKMPGFKDSLSKAEILAVNRYVRGLR